MRKVTAVVRNILGQRGIGLLLRHGECSAMVVVTIHQQRQCSFRVLRAVHVQELRDDATRKRSVRVKSFAAHLVQERKHGPGILAVNGSPGIIGELCVLCCRFATVVVIAAIAVVSYLVLVRVLLLVEAKVGGKRALETVVRGQGSVVKVRLAVVNSGVGVGVVILTVGLRR